MLFSLSEPQPAVQVWRTVFLAVLAIGIAFKAWLAWRQIRHVGRHRNAVPAAFARTISLQAHQKAADYTMAQTRFGLVELLYGALLLLGWTVWGGLQILHSLSLKGFSSSMLQQLSLLAGFAILQGLLELPLGWYRTFRLEARFGFNTSTPALWLADLLKNTVLAALFGLPLAALILWFMQQTGQAWWLWSWAVWVGFGLLMMVVYPAWIAPLFNRFQPLKNPEIVQRVTALMQRCGFSARGLYVMDGSRRSAHANAYFTGFGAAKRVVFYDTLLRQLSVGEVEAVLAHELGHFKHRHIIQRIVSMFAFSLLGFALLGWLSTQSWFYTGLGVYPAVGLSADWGSAPNDALALLLFMLATPVFTQFISPLFSQLSRKHEFQADAYAAAQTQAADLASALLKLYEDNASTLTPDPVYVKFYYSHPPASERLARLSYTP